MVGLREEMFMVIGGARQSMVMGYVEAYTNMTLLLSMRSDMVAVFFVREQELVSSTSFRILRLHKDAVLALAA